MRCAHRHAAQLHFGENNSAHGPTSGSLLQIHDCRRAGSAAARSLRTRPKDRRPRFSSQAVDIPVCALPRLEGRIDIWFQDARRGVLDREIRAFPDETDKRP
jgi:hypothetical protein